MNNKKKFLALLPLGVLLGCAPDLKPRELLDASDAYKRAQNGTASQFALAELETAKQALQKAEAAWQKGEEEKVKDLSYMAERQAQLAQAAGDLQQANRDRADAIKAQKQAQSSFQEETERRLEDTRRKLDVEARRAQRQREQLRSTNSRLAAAERKAAAALASLEQLAKVKEEARGVVITLSGGVLFATGRYELLPIARNKLDEVAKALDDQGYKSIVVEGHTDSRGGDSANMRLSELRATSVTTHLISRGIDRMKIRAAGVGETRPVASNSTPEGRANNRRVEIVVQPE